MNYKLVFKEPAKKEWDKLDSTIKQQFKKRLIERLENPRIESARLSGMTDCYKIKLRSAGYRLVYQVRDNEVLISVIAVGRRDRNHVYKQAVKRM